MREHLVSGQCAPSSENEKKEETVILYHSEGWVVKGRQGKRKGPWVIEHPRPQIHKMPTERSDFMNPLTSIYIIPRPALIVKGSHLDSLHPPYLWSPFNFSSTMLATTPSLIHHSLIPW
jgi:hypothetical protein